MTERTIQVGDLVELHTGPSYKLYDITGISDAGITINDNGNEVLLISVGDVWQVQNFTVQHSIKFLNGVAEPVLTGVDDTNINVLMRLSYNDIKSMCMVDMYFKKLCDNGTIWRQKISKEYPGIIPFMISKHGPNINYEELYRRLHVSQLNIDIVIKKEFLDVLEWILNKAPRLAPKVVDAATANGHLAILEKMISLSHLPSTKAINEAAGNGHLHILKRLSLLTPPLRPDTLGADAAAANNRVEVLKWMVFLRPPLFPTIAGLDKAAEKGHLEVLKSVRRWNNLARPSDDGIKAAILNGHINVMNWINEIGYQKWNEMGQKAPPPYNI